MSELICLICKDIDDHSYTYAHTKAHNDIQNIASMKAFSLCSCISADEKLDYYMMFYRIEYTKLYNDSYKQYIEEFIQLTVEKFQNENDICGYHCENVRWHKYPESRYH